MNKYILPVIISVMCATTGYSQSLTVKELTYIAGLSHPQAIQYLTTEKHFKLSSSKTIYNQTISQFVKDTLGMGEAVIKHQWEDNKRIIPSVHYEAKPRSYIEAILKELQHSNFKLSTKQDDSRKHYLLYENDSFSVIIYIFEDKKLPASIEVHGK